MPSKGQSDGAAVHTRAGERYYGHGSIAEQGERATRFVLAGALATFAAVALVLTLLVLYAHEQIDEAHHELDLVIDTTARIPLMAEKLTLAVNLAAATGEARWTERYRTISPALTAAVRLIQLTTRRFGGAGNVRPIDEALTARYALDAEAFRAIAAGAPADAHAILNSARYRNADMLLERHAEEMLGALVALEEERPSQIERQLAIAGALAVLIGFLVVGFIVRHAMRSINATHLRAAEELRRITHYDPLTGLHNYLAFDATLNGEVDAVNASPDLRLAAERQQNQRPMVGGAAWAVARQEDPALEAQPCTVVVSLDLNGFRAINDKHGHAVGDTLLYKVAQRLAQSFADSFVARVGGDEFMVLAASHRFDLADVRQMVVMAIRAVDRPIRVFDLDMRVGASAGLARIEPGMTALDVRRAADLALFAAKREGDRSAVSGKRVNAAVVFDDEMYAAHLEQLANERRVRKALSSGEFVAFFQPVVNLQDGTIRGAEALARWTLSDGRVVAPGSFLPALQQLGLLPELTFIILDHACREALTWPYPVKVSINVEPTQLEGDFAHRLFARLEAIGFPPHRLVIEILETALATQIEDIRDVLQTLRAAGIEIALDDFGVGYSSLGQLATLPIDSLKIDRTFIAAMAAAPEIDKTHANSGRAVVQAALDLSRSFGLRVIAEGIETERDFARLAQMGCGYGQGYVFARPLNADAFRQFLADANPAGDHPVLAGHPPPEQCPASADQTEAA